MSSTTESLSRKICIAPMMDCTDRHCRYLLRLISRHAFLYTEMLTTGAVLHGDRGRLLSFHAAEHPVAIQMGGSDPAALARCAQIAEDFGYDEVNLNVGCPSDRVQAGRFGVCLMLEPELVAACVDSMRAACSLPVTVKTRIGVDEHDAYEDLAHFVQTVSAAGCRTFIVHARKAWLRGLSPRENRTVPPLRYHVVHQLKRDFPALEIVINGGFVTLDQVEGQLAHVDGAMIGREAYHNPYLLAGVDGRFFDAIDTPPTRREIAVRFRDYMDAELRRGVPAQRCVRHLLGLYLGQPGARAWRRFLCEQVHADQNPAWIVDYALAQLPETDGEAAVPASVCGNAYP